MLRGHHRASRSGVDGVTARDSGAARGDLARHGRAIALRRMLSPASHGMLSRGLRWAGLGANAGLFFGTCVALNEGADAMPSGRSGKAMMVDRPTRVTEFIPTVVAPTFFCT